MADKPGEKSYDTEYEAQSAALAAAIEQGGEVWSHQSPPGLQGFEHDLESEDEEGNPSCLCNPKRIW